MSNKSIIEQALTHLADPSTREQYFHLYADAIVLHGYDGVAPGLDGVKAFYGSMWNAFPDLSVAAQDYIEEGDKVSVRFELTGTHQGPFQGIPATGRPIRIPGITILRFEDGKCVERWSQLNALLLLTQLGAFPPPA